MTLDIHTLTIRTARVDGLPVVRPRMTPVTALYRARRVHCVDGRERRRVGCWMACMLVPIGWLVPQSPVYFNCIKFDVISHLFEIQLGAYTYISVY